MEGNVFVYESEKAIVSIHPGKLTESQRNEVLIKASKEFYKAIRKQGLDVGGTNHGCK